MAVLRLVVDRRAALHDLLQFGGVEFLVLAGGAPDFLGQRERGAAVAIGHADERDRAHRASSGSGRPSICSARASSFSIAAASSDLNTSTRARDSSGALSSNDGFSVVAPTRMMVPSSITGRKRVLLRAVEAMDLVDEQQRALPQFAAAARLLEHLFEVGDAGEDRGNLLEMQVGRLRQQPRHRGLAGAGRAPEHERAERARRQHARERAVGAEQMVLPDHLVELVRAQPVGERTRRVLVEAGGGEQRRSALWRAGSSVEDRGNLLPAAADDDAPGAARRRR